MEEQDPALSHEMIGRLLARLDHVENNLAHRQLTEIDRHNVRFEVLTGESNLQSKQTEQRLQHFSQRPLILFESTVTYQTQLQGRFRWEVAVKMTLVDESGNKLHRNFTTPVFHQFHHEREVESLYAALPTIKRQLEGLIEDYIRGQEP